MWTLHVLCKVLLLYQSYSASALTEQPGKKCAENDSFATEEPITNLENCVSTCEHDASCSAVTMKNNRCLIFTTCTVTNQDPGENVTFYLRIKEDDEEGLSVMIYIVIAAGGLILVIGVVVLAYKFLNGNNRKQDRRRSSTFSGQSKFSAQTATTTKTDQSKYSTYTGSTGSTGKTARSNRSAQTGSTTKTSKSNYSVTTGSTIKTDNSKRTGKSNASTGTTNTTGTDKSKNDDDDDSLSLSDLGSANTMDSKYKEYGRITPLTTADSIILTKDHVIGNLKHHNPAEDVDDPDLKGHVHFHFDSKV